MLNVSGIDLFLTLNKSVCCQALRLYLNTFCPPGHLMSTAEVEAALMLHPAVSEAAAVSRPHKVKGECLYCFVTLKDCREFDNKLVEELKRGGLCRLKQNNQTKPKQPNQF